MKFISILFSLSLILSTMPAHSRDTALMLPIQDALKTSAFKNALDPSIKLYFGKQSHPRIIKSVGTFPTNNKTNAFNKTDEAACQWVFLSGLLALQNRAKREGGNAVVNISSYYKKKTVNSKTKFECHAGAFIAGAALIGKVVKIAK